MRNIITAALLFTSLSLFAHTARAENICDHFPVGACTSTGQVIIINRMFVGYAMEQSDHAAQHLYDLQAFLHRGGDMRAVILYWNVSVLRWPYLNGVSDLPISRPRLRLRGPTTDSRAMIALAPLPGVLHSNAVATDGLLRLW